MSAALIAWCALCALQDARHRLISNLLTLPALVLAAGYLLFSGQSLTGASPLQAMSALGLALLFSLPGYLRGHMGAADVKMLSALGLASDVMHLLLSIAGAGLAMLIWAWLAPRCWPHLPATWHQHLRQLEPDSPGGQPYAPFLLCGLLLAVIWHLSR